MARSKIADLLEKLTRFVPGISGYQDREKRRASDKAVRDNAAGSVLKCRELVLGIMADLSRSKGLSNLKSVGLLEGVAVKLERLEDEMRYAPYGYSGFFDREGISLDDLEALYETDLELLEAAVALAGLVDDSPPRSDSSGWVKDLEDALDELSALVGRRNRKMEIEGD